MEMDIFDARLLRVVGQEQSASGFCEKLVAV
jgi:hypothetical protein